MKKEGYLVKLSTGRYSIDGEYELTSGNVIEVLISGVWERTSIESFKGEYYLVNGFPIDGAYVRIN